MYLTRHDYPSLMKEEAVAYYSYSMLNSAILLILIKDTHIWQFCCTDLHSPLWHETSFSIITHFMTVLLIELLILTAGIVQWVIIVINWIWSSNVFVSWVDRDTIIYISTNIFVLILSTYSLDCIHVLKILHECDLK